MSVIAAALKHMLASKMKPDEIVAAVEAMEAEIAAPQRTARQEQNARAYAKRKALKPAEMTLNQHAETPTETAEFSTPEATPARAPTCGNSTNLSTTSNRQTDGAEGKAREEISIADAISPDLPCSTENDLLGEPIRLPPSTNRRRSDEAEIVKAAETWNDIAGRFKLPQVEILDPRMAGIRRMLKTFSEYGWTSDEGMARIEQKIRGSPYLKGEVNGFRCTFDFVLQPKSLLKILEGNFDGESRGKNQGRNGYAPRH